MRDANDKVASHRFNQFTLFFLMYLLDDDISAPQSVVIPKLIDYY